MVFLLYFHEISSCNYSLFQMNARKIANKHTLVGDNVSNEAHIVLFYSSIRMTKVNTLYKENYRNIFLAFTAVKFY